MAPPAAPSDVATLPALFAGLGSATPAERDRAWDAFVREYSALLIRVARVVMRHHDAAMDAYAFILDQLRDGNGRRLSAYTATEGCTFETWLAVVARRLCLDHHRHKYGRPRGDDAASIESQSERRRLVDLVSVELDLQPEIATSDPAPDAALHAAEIQDALKSVLGELPPRDQLLLRYRFDDELSAIQIMRVMKFRSVFHVYRRINAILAQCRAALQHGGFEASDA